MTDTLMQPGNGIVAACFRCDQWNRRVARQDGTGPWKHWVFTPDGQPLAELEKPATSQGTWTVLREYVWLEGRPVAQIEYPGPVGGTEGHVYAVHTDHLGQPRVLTSRTGAVVWSAPVERPYGEVTETVAVDPASGRQVATNLRLPGQYDERLLTAAGIQGPYYNWHRWYLPGMGRYMELDPIAVAGGFNGRYGPDWYGYAEGNPTRYSDSRGLTIWKVAYRIGRVAVRYGRELTRGRALNRLIRGQDVATDSARAMKKLNKDASLVRGGPGRCVVESGPTGMPHGHPAADPTGAKRFPGHVFFDPSLTLPWYLEIIDDNDDGAIDADDVLEAINPFPIPMRIAGSESI